MIHPTDNETVSVSSGSFDMAQARLTHALDRLQSAIAALSAQSGPGAAEAHAEQLEKECAILKEENEKLNHLLHDAVNRYARLSKTANEVGEKLDQTILRLELMLEDGELMAEDGA